MREEVNIWWKQAKKDFESAEKNYKLKEYYLVAFLCQQAVEKALKALLIKKLKNPEEFINKHSLIFLGKKCKVPNKFYPFLRDLTRDYIIARYPGIASLEEPPYELYDEEKARKVLKETKLILEWIKKQLKL